MAHWPMPKSDIPRCAHRSGDLPSSLIAEVAKSALPDAVETRRTLLRIRKERELTRGKLAALLGVDISTLRRWEDGKRRPCAPARRAVQLVERAFFRPQDFPREPLLSALSALQPDLRDSLGRMRQRRSTSAESAPSHVETKLAA